MSSIELQAGKVVFGAEMFPHGGFTNFSFISKLLAAFSKTSFQLFSLVFGH